jgi:predicted NACHT family NTPase
MHELQSASVRHRQMGHSWQFTQQQARNLKRYYDANQLLLDCLYTAKAVSEVVQQHVEHTFLLLKS